MEQIDKFEKIEVVLRHIENVQRNCYRLGKKLMKDHQFELGRNLIANGQIHDNSKFKGIEFDELFFGSPILHDVVKHHASTNPHHSEYWGRIQEMPDVYVAEMVCDWAARSAEFASDLRHWVVNTATAKYSFTMEEPIGMKIVYFIDMLIDKPFK